MSKIFFRVSIVFFVIFGLSACTTTVPARKFDSPESIPDTSTGFLLPVTFSSDRQLNLTGTCSLTITEIESKKKYSVELQVSKSTLFAALPTGAYSIDTLSCGSNSRWQMKGHFWTTFWIVDGKVSLLAPISFGIVDNFFTWRSLPPIEAIVEIRKIYASLPKTVRPQLMSGYTKTMITEAMLKTEPMMRVDVSNERALQDAGLKLTDLPSFNECYVKELRVNPLIVGSLKIDFEFGNLKLQKPSIRPDPNTYSSQFVTCVKSEVEKLKWTSRSSIRVSYQL